MKTFGRFLCVVNAKVLIPPQRTFHAEPVTVKYVILACPHRLGHFTRAFLLSFGDKNPRLVTETSESGQGAPMINAPFNGCAIKEKKTRFFCVIQKVVYYQKSVFHRSSSDVLPPHVAKLHNSLFCTLVKVSNFWVSFCLLS